MKTLFAVIVASVYGLTLRLLFGFFDEFMGIMSLAFLALVPMLIGFVTVILISPKTIGNNVAAFFVPWLTSLVLLVITIILNIEGAICWIMIFPLFAIMAGFGGIIAYMIRKRREQKKEDAPVNNRLNAFLFFIIPPIIGLVEGERSLHPEHIVITKETVIAAPPRQVWQGLLNINTVAVDERHSSLSGLLGFPEHLQTTLDEAAVGGRRIAIYEKGLFFEETIAQYEDNKLMVLDMKIDPHKIPATVMDEHILIGGKYLDILQDTYQLEALPNGQSKLKLSSRFYINTPFNWYSTIWAHYLMSDILQSELELVKCRATAESALNETR